MKKYGLIFIVQFGIFLLIVPCLFSLQPPTEGPLGPMPGWEWDPVEQKYIGETKVAPPTRTPSIEEQWREIGLAQLGEAFPFSIQVIDPDKKVFQVTLGDPTGSNVSVKVGPEGIYDPSGRLQGPSFTVELNGQRFAIQVKQFTPDSTEQIDIVITPESGGFPISGSYRKEFSLGHFRGEVRIDGEGARPTLSIAIRNPEHAQAAFDVATDGEVSLDVKGVIDLGEEQGELGRGTADIRTFRISDDGVHIDGGIIWQITRGGYTLALKLGDYLKIADTRVKIDERVCSILEQMFTNESIRAHLQELYPGLTLDEIIEMVSYRLTDLVNNLKDTFRGIVEGGPSRDAVKVPDSLRFFLNLENRDRHLFSYLDNAFLTRD